MIEKLRADNSNLEGRIHEKKNALKNYDDKKKVIITEKLKAQKEVT
jgi:hypothetical protein